MRQGFVKAAAVTPKIKVADTKYNAELILDMMKESTRQGAKIVVFPELCLTGYTCQDLFLQERLLQGAKDALMKLVKGQLSGEPSSTRIISRFLYVCSTMLSTHLSRYFSTL